MFTVDSKTELYLKNLGVQFDYRESVSFAEFHPDWQAVNHGRPEHQARVEEAVLTYAEMMEQGSAAPAVILHVMRDGQLDVLDGVQRSLAAETAGFTKVAAYVVRCADAMADKIRMAANLRLQGAAPVDADWAMRMLVQAFMIDGSDSAKDIASVCGRSVREIECVHARLLATRRIESLYNGSGAPALKVGTVDAIAQSSEPDDFTEAPKVVKDFIDLIDSCKFANGENKRLVEFFFGIKRRGGVKRTTQLRTKLQQIKEDPIVVTKKTGTVEPAIKVLRALRSLQTVVKKYRRDCKANECSLDSLELADEMDGLLKESGRLLRECCDNRVRRNRSDIFCT